MSAPAIALEGLHKAFGGPEEPVVLFGGLNWTLETGRSAAIVGESGTGKTTLLHLAATLDRPDAGEVRLAGQATGQRSEHDLAALRTRHVGLLFQFHFLLKEFTAIENVALPAWLAGVPRSEAWDRAQHLLRAVGLDSRLKHFPHQLSGGERQRVALARALINDPPLVLADEPTGNLDVKHARVVQDLLLDLVAHQGKTLLLVTHDLEFARRADEVWRLVDGQLVAE